MALNNWQQCLGISALNNMHYQQDLSCNQSCQRPTLLAGVLYLGGVSACRRTSTRRFELFFLVRQEEPDFEDALCYKLLYRKLYRSTSVCLLTPNCYKVNDLSWSWWWYDYWNVVTYPVPLITRSYSEFTICSEYFFNWIER